MFEYSVVDMLPIRERCVVFTGHVSHGAVRVGDVLRLRSPAREVVVKVTSLEPSGFRQSGAVAGDNVAVVVEPFDLDAIADGFCVSGQAYQVKALTLLEREI